MYTIQHSRRRYVPSCFSNRQHSRRRGRKTCLCLVPGMHSILMPVLFYTGGSNTTTRPLRQIPTSAFTVCSHDCFGLNNNGGKLWTAVRFFLWIWFMCAQEEVLPHPVAMHEPCRDHLFKRTRHGTLVFTLIWWTGLWGPVCSGMWKRPLSLSHLILSRCGQNILPLS